MQFKLHINGNFKPVWKVLKETTNERPALQHASIELYDIENVRMILANGYFLSDIKIKVTDMDNQPLTADNAPKHWIALPMKIFGDVKQMKSRRYSASDAHYIIDIEIDEEESEQSKKDENVPLVGTATVHYDGKSMIYALGNNGLTPRMLKHVYRYDKTFVSDSEERKSKWLESWDGFVTISFSIEYLQAMIDAQRAQKDDSHIQITVDAYKWSAYPDAPPPLWVNKAVTGNSNIGMLMPVMLRGENKFTHEQNQKYLDSRQPVDISNAPKV